MFKKIKEIYFILIFIIISVNYESQTLTLNGSNWTPTIPSITEAGNNYNGIYESATDQISLNVSVPLLLGTAKVSVSYQSNPTWNSNLILSAKRTSNGSTLCVLCVISGGTTYQNITLTETELFRIQAVLALASYSGINIQFQLSGVSVTIPAASYQSKIIFTVSPL